MSNDLQSELRFGNKSAEVIVRTDERYGSDGLFQGPRGWSFWNGLEDARPIQNPNFWPDFQSTYFLFQMELPAGSVLTQRFEFPRVRYMQYALYKGEEGTFVSTGEYASGAQLEPDEGSTNPYRVGADPQVEKRDCTIRIVAEDPPADPASRPRNTLYAGRDEGVFLGVVRLYLSSRGWDGTGWGPANGPSAAPPFRYDCTLEDGTRLTPDEIADRFARPFSGAVDPLMTPEQWVALVNAEDNDPALASASAPARVDSQWEKYWNFKYSVVGAFKTPEDRAEIPYATAIDGGGDPTTQYFILHLSREFGPVYVMRGTMPTFPDTFAGGLATVPETQMKYMSIATGEAAPSGQLFDGICDMQIPLDPERNYTIVVSRPEDRPANATTENGIAWLEWPARGEGIEHPANRKNFAMMMMRIMATNPTWKERPDNITVAGTEEEVMGPYFPRGEYLDKAGFEALGSAAAIHPEGGPYTR